jgi:hypothetical protein
LVELSSSGTSRHPATGKGLVDDGDTVFEGHCCSTGLKVVNASRFMFLTGSVLGLANLSLIAAGFQDVVFLGTAPP